ncbi:sigma-70 family RNA polymerase sigma factor [Rhodopirellula sallentina]|uniref:sigma-70 family RNA polymerase sigma factor n=1 Tax=Rhodopirellula sallentina TaxID=1263869 RepID=UPI0005C7B822|nr:sigma-70 family RNA polymerase sigma factor [Rhodopirellula sallentina]
MDTKQRMVERPVETFVLLTDAQPRLYGFLLKRIGNKEYAHEILQNVNLTICKKSSSFKPGSNFMAWAYAIARIELMSFRRELSSERIIFTESLASKLDQADKGVEEESSIELRKVTLQNCLNKLSLREQKIVALRYTESVPVNMIAKELERTANAVSISLHRIHEKLLGCVKRTIAGGLDE